MVLQPDFTHPQLALLYPICSPVLTGLQNMLAGKLAPHESQGTLNLSMIISIMLFNLCTSASLIHLNLPALGILAMAGLIWGSAFCFIFFAFRSCPAPIVISFQYSQLFWVLLWGWLLFGETPDALTMMGMAVIACAGLALIHFSTQKKDAA